MSRNSTFNILMYCHDTYGLGHIRRTLAIADHLRQKNINILILTGSPIVGRFAFPEQIDFVRIPGMIKKTNEEYLPLSIKINPRHALDIRKNIITATAKTFQPQLFIVDKEPLGLKKEVLPTLQWLQRSLPRSQTILGLRDIMDDAKTVRNAWKKKKYIKSWINITVKYGRMASRIFMIRSKSTVFPRISGVKFCLPATFPVRLYQERTPFRRKKGIKSVRRTS